MFISSFFICHVHLFTIDIYYLKHRLRGIDFIWIILHFQINQDRCYSSIVLMPYPNTQLYRDLEKEGRLLYDGKWWLHPDYRFNYASFIPKRMTPDELTEVALEVRSRFNSIGSIIARAFDFKTNMRNPYRLGVYLAYNPLFRKETFKKQGMRFGEKK